MDCEICGKNLSLGKKIVLDLDGTELVVCEDCSGFGSKIDEIEEPVKEKKKPVGQASVVAGKPKTALPKEKELDLGLELVADYGTVIRRAREKKKLTIEELAKKIFEKESTLHRIESQAMLPSDEIVKKLEKELEIDLSDSLPDEKEVEEFKPKAEPIEGFTLADLLKKKKD